MKLLSSRYASIINYDLSSLQALWFGTESCSIDAIKNVKSKLPKVKFIHSYGPTETTCTSHIYFCSEKDFEISSQVLPIGKPLPKVTSFIINDRGEYAKVGEIGELYISGVQVMLGYCNDVEMTNKALVNNVYKTGDYAEIDIRGNYIFHGRKDDMVKINGKLIYLTEIETIACRYHGVEDAIAIVEDQEIIKTIKLYVISKSELSIREEELKNYIEQYLPQYMIPNKIVLYKNSLFPRNSAGKIDRKQISCN